MKATMQFATSVYWWEEGRLSKILTSVVKAYLHVPQKS